MLDTHRTSQASHRNSNWRPRHWRPRHWRTIVASLCSLVGLSALVGWRHSEAHAVLIITVRGIVRDAATRAPIGSAQVTIVPPGDAAILATTLANGRYSVRVPVASHSAALRIVVQGVGYQALRTQTVANGDTVTLDLMLTSSTPNVNTVLSASDVRDATKGINGAAQGAASAPATMIAGGRVAEMQTSGKYDAARKQTLGQPAMTRTERRAYESEIDRNRHATWPTQSGNREQYDRIVDNPFLSTRSNPRSTFSVDVDRASYGNVRRFLTNGQLPPADAVRIEELVNYFPYHLDEPRGDAPIAITTDAMPAPWQHQHQLVRIALQARRIETSKLPPSNLVFLIDVSGSMMTPDKLPLVKASLRLLVEQLRPRDRVALVVYAGAAGVVLPSTDGNDKSRIMEAIDRLEAGGSTAGGAGLALAYQVAREHFERGGNNRVILATDGDFNVGPSSDGEMERLIESKRDEGTYLTVLGFGTGNYQDAKMKKMAKIGNGNYAYVDQLDEARKVLVHEMGATLVTVANDVKLQIEFNPARVASFRLIGYEDRLLRDEDFADDKKDAGDMGSGHTVTALYEVVPVGVRGTVTVREAEPLRYTPDAAFANDASGRRSADDELLFVKLRYKTPGESTSQLMSKAVRTRDVTEHGTDDMRFAAAVASFGMLMRGSEYKGDATASSVLSLVRRSSGDDDDGYRAEFAQLVQRWQELSRGVTGRPHPDNR